MEGSVVGLFRNVDWRLVLLMSTFFMFGGPRVRLVVSLVRAVVREEVVDAWVSFRRLGGDECLALGYVRWVGGFVGCLIRLLVRLGMGVASGCVWL